MDQSNQPPQLDCLNNIFCPLHPSNKVILFDMSSETFQRSKCQECALSSKTINIKKCFNLQNDDFQKQKSGFFMKEMTFNHSIMKIIEESYSTLVKLQELIQQQKTLIKNSIQDLQEQLLEAERVFEFRNYEQLENFAQQHYKLYYSKQINFEEWLNNACAPSCQKINECCDQILSVFTNQIQTINMNLQMLENQINSRVLQSQTKSSIRLNLQNNFQNLKNVLFDENGLNLLISNNNIIQFYKFQANKRQFLEAGREIKLVGTLEAICLQKKFEWFVEASKVNGQTEITFWDIKFDPYTYFVCSFSQKISNLNLLDIKQLAIDEKNSNFFIFTELQFISITPIKQKEHKKYVYQHQNFIKAELNTDQTLLSVQSQQNSNYVIHVYTIPNISKLKQPNQFKILNIQEDRLFDFFFFTSGLNNYFLIYQNQEISIQQLQLNSLKTNLLYKLPVYSGSVIFNQNSLSISLIMNDPTQLIIYKVIKNQNKEQEFEIKFLSQINSESGFLNCFFSQNGKFLAVSSNLPFSQQLSIYQISHLPCFKIAPSRRSLSNLYG